MPQLVRSLSVRSGLPVYTFRRILLLTACILGVFQYGMVLTNGASVSDFDTYYGLTDAQGKTLYAFLNFGACALSFLPGLCYDRWGCIPTMILGTIIFDAGVLLQMVWTPMFPAWLSTMQGLTFCYMAFGFASTFFNVIGSFAPLLAFPAKDTGKVSACVQVCMSLGITIQSMAYYWIKGLGGDAVMNYLIYALVFTNTTGILMCVVFWSARALLNPSQPGTEDVASVSDDTFVCGDELRSESPDGTPLPPSRGGSMSSSRPKSLSSIVHGLDFAFMNALFVIAVGFAFSFLDLEDQIASEVGMSSRDLTTTFGVLNALGRLSVSLPLDFTRNHPWGGVYVYISGGLAIFALGILLLALPVESLESQKLLVRMANSTVAFGYGCLLGIVPPALKILFGGQHLGLIYGILYVGVAISEPVWSLLFRKSDSCSGIGCYTVYYLSCVAATGCVFLMSLSMLLRAARATNSLNTSLGTGLCANEAV